MDDEHEDEQECYLDFTSLRVSCAYVDDEQDDEHEYHHFTGVRL